MEAASGGYVDIVKLLIGNAADVNAQSSAGMYNDSDKQTSETFTLNMNETHTFYKKAFQ